MIVWDFLRMQHFGMVCLLLAFQPLFCSNALCQEISARVGEATWEIKGDKVIITYELFLPVDRMYDIGVLLRRKSNKSFRLFPKATEGAVGQLEYAGGRNQILWDYKRDIRSELNREDYWFQITAREIRDGGGISWWVYAAGGAAAAVVGAILLLNGDDEPDLLPEPPNTRPGKN